MKPVTDYEIRDIATIRLQRILSLETPPPKKTKQKKGKVHDPLSWMTPEQRALWNQATKTSKSI